MESAGNSYLKIRWLGHAGFKITFNDVESGFLSTTERVIYIDAWLDNPKFPDDLKSSWTGSLNDADLVLVTHCEVGHSASAPKLVKDSKKSGAKIVGNGEVLHHF